MLTPTGKPGEFRDTTTGELINICHWHFVVFSVGTFAEVPPPGTKNEALEPFVTQAKALLAATGSPYSYNHFLTLESFLSNDDRRWHFRIACGCPPLPTPPQAEKVDG